MHISYVVLLAGVLGAAAHPSGHAHLHRSVHEKRAGRPKFYKAIHHSPIPIPTTTSVPEPEPTTAETKAEPTKPAAPTTPATDAAGDAGGDEMIPFCAGKKAKRVTEAQVMYTGNLGECGYNANIMVVPNKIAHHYDYVQTYTNVDSTEYEVSCSNKMGPDGKLTGMFSVNAPQHVKFKLAPGEKKTVVVQANTQAICAFSKGSIPTTPWGQLAGNWVETDSGNTSNGGWSGADCSSLVPQHYNMDVPGCSVCSAGTCSNIFPGGHGVNAYTKGMEELDGIGLNIPAGPYTMDVKVGFH
ncbi:hypothetical protein B0H66DRAFT_542439 [Apodospora peruviana]|uniref:Allergen Asp f 4 n=1 Tax=Apodospora peruviana TaxID=516989 RepID=A0AAE0MFN5_9PEZI|nr:hypothetical protein B0H66DRAFT_542439 [Apodospora peruviana]